MPIDKIPSAGIESGGVAPSNLSTGAPTWNTSGNVGIGTSSPATGVQLDTFGGYMRLRSNTTINADISGNANALVFESSGGTGEHAIIAGGNASNNFLSFYTTNAAAPTERARIDSSGNLLVGNTTFNSNLVGVICGTTGRLYATANSATPINIDRLTNDGVLVDFRQANTSEGNISVSGTTVSYNGGHLARWSQLLDNSKDESILKGTVLSNLDEMCVWEKDGVVAENEQLNKMKVSDVEGDTNVAGVFVNWTKDEDYNSDDMNIAMTGDMIIRIAQGVTVQRGDLLMSAGDGTAKPQGDDIIRSKTIAKVTSIHVTCTYEDGSYCVPCVLMAC
jgi:hypothetical protein